ncbi:uncharacterized protein [Coffea arabica]|uniref:Uncharacterized protein n=1 Tax=Coffea arabica TaxID=13443 RepID=A0A6P6SP93_COFAR|nr:uncharacterized protein LOC113693316 [Coffea arabica]
MALLWSNEIKVTKVIGTSFTIEAKIEDEEKKESWWFIGIYASCDYLIRRGQWEVIGRRKAGWGKKWIIIGEFNDIVSNEEKWGGRNRDDRSFQDFRNLVDDNQLLDIGFEGKPWTWCNNWYGDGEVKERLDRGLCTLEWSQCFSEANCKHIESHASDHRTRWYQVSQKIKNCRVELLKWNSSKKGNSLERINACKNKIEDIKASIVGNKSQQIQEAKKQLKAAYDV